MESLDSLTRHELSKSGYVFTRNASSSDIVKKLLKDLNGTKNQLGDINQLCKRNNELSLTAMLYKSQIEEKDAEIKQITEKALSEQRVLEDKVRYFENLAANSASDEPRSNFFRRLALKDVDPETISVIRNADKRLHELDEANRTLTLQLDKNLSNSGILINKIRLRDAEIQRLTQLVNSGALPSVSQKPNHELIGVLREENAKLQKAVDELRSSNKSNSDGADLRTQLSRAIADRRDLARQVDHLTVKVTALQGVQQKYEHELKMARLERDEAIRQTSSINIDASESIRRGHRVVQDENGNVTNYGCGRKTQKGSVNFERQSEHGVSMEEEIDEGMRRSNYEKKINRLSADLAILRDGISKKDCQIRDLRSEMAMLCTANGENDALRTEVESLRQNATAFKGEIKQLHERIAKYTAEAARVVDFAEETGNDRRKASGQHHDLINRIQLSEGPYVSDISHENINGTSDKRPTNPMTGRTSALENVGLQEKLTLLECEVRRLQAKALLEEENRLRTEARLRQMEENPTKKFKGQLRIDSGVLRTQFELQNDDTS